MASNPPVLYILAFLNVPSPLPNKTATKPFGQPLPHPGPVVATARSSLPSPFKSPTATRDPKTDAAPELKVNAFLKVTSPFPNSTPTPPVAQLLPRQPLATTKSSLPSPLTSAMLME